MCSVLGQDPQTPLQPYCARDDGVFDWAVYDIVYGVDYDTYIINFTSCLWLTPKDTDISLWYNILQIAVPHNLDKTSPYGAIYADGGHRGDIPAHQGDEFAGIIATRTGNLVGHLQDIPNEPAKFYGEKPKPRRRTEDALIAYTWSHFINNSDAPEWLARLPMVKSVKMAMDVMAQFATQYNFGTLSKFAIAGASKRGWTTWLTPACDDRVVAIVPIVMPMGNMQKVINKLWRSLGLWSFALDDYQALNLMAYLNTPNFTKMAAIIDPILYKASLARIPKFLITASGDEFFIPDAHREFWSDVPGVKYMRVVPNSEHSMAGHAYRVIKQISVFLNHLKNNTLPGMSKSQLVYSNTTASITVWPAGNPTSVTLWQATTLSSTRRDFRLIVCADISKCINPVIWYSSSVPPSRDGSYTASVSAPSSGWTGFMLEVAYGSSDADFMEFTTEVNIVPDVYPFEPCGQSGGCNPPNAREAVRENLKFRKPARPTH